MTALGRGVAVRLNPWIAAAQVALPQSPILLLIAASLHPVCELSTPSENKCSFADTQTVQFCSHRDTVNRQPPSAPMREASQSQAVNPGDKNRG